MKKTRLRLIQEVVKSVIDRWDPYGLLAHGAPADEFDSEIAAVARQVDRITEPKDAACVISRVFSSAFQPEGFEPERCTEVGQALFEALEEHDLLNYNS
jgi:hypothetical protein